MAQSSVPEPLWQRPGSSHTLRHLPGSLEYTTCRSPSRAPTLIGSCITLYSYHFTKLLSLDRFSSSAIGHLLGRSRIRFGLKLYLSTRDSLGSMGLRSPRGVLFPHWWQRSSMCERIVALRKACRCAGFSLLILQQRATERSGATAVSDDARCSPPSAPDCSIMCREYVLSDHICMSALMSGRKLHCCDCRFVEPAIGRMRRCFKFAVSEETIEQQFRPPGSVGPSLFDAFFL